MPRQENPLSAPFSQRLRAAASIATAILCVQPRIAAAQSRAEIQVRAFVDSFFAEAAAGKWDAAARRVDMKAFDKILKQAQDAARSDPSEGVVTVDAIMAGDPAMPRAVAQWEADRGARTRQTPLNYIIHEFARVSTLPEFLALSPDEAASRWLEARDFRYRARLDWKEIGCTGDLPSNLSVPERHTVRGVAIGDDSTAYVIQTAAAIVSGHDMLMNHDAPLLMVLGRRGSAWKIDPNFPRNAGGPTAFFPCGTKR
jgi:hypothetical protein